MKKEKEKIKVIKKIGNKIIQVQAGDWDEYNRLVDEPNAPSILRPNDPHKDQYGTGA